LASTLDSDEISDLRDQFDAMDMDRNGTITLDEMRIVSTFYVLYYCVGIFLLATAGIFLSFVCGDDVIWSVDGWVTYNNSLMYLGMCFAKALQKDQPWMLKESRVLEILQAVCRQNIFQASAKNNKLSAHEICGGVGSSFFSHKKNHLYGALFDATDGYQQRWVG
jgi:hypothetical protein